LYYKVNPVVSLKIKRSELYKEFVKRIGIFPKNWIFGFLENLLGRKRSKIFKGYWGF